MRVRDRLILAVVAAVIVVAAVWLVLVSPERSKVSSLDSQISTERATLASAQAALASARATAAGYPNDVGAISQVMRAVPPDPQEAPLVTLITKLAGTSVDVHEFSIGAAAAGAGGPVALGISFTFKTTYGALQNFISQLDNLIRTDGSNIAATGRLFTVNSVSLTPLPPNRTTATVTVTTYAQNAATPTAATATGATGATSTTTSTTP